ncbi:hypothetical protein B0H14DRAFT_3427159 [Mycena olivaceomarginata]|nr:hypothetical protein B0H14DRAFT_3427159 [Mycena olivaceomarginata]
MAHHLSTEQLNVNSMFTAAASTAASHAVAFLRACLARDPRSLDLYRPRSPRTLLEHVACEEPMHPSSPADRHPSFVSIAVGNTRTSADYIPPTRTVSWEGPSTKFSPMWSILLCRCHPVGLARCRLIYSTVLTDANYGKHHAILLPLNDLPLDWFLPTPRSAKHNLSLTSPTKRRIFAEERIAMASSPNTAPATVTSPRIFLPMLHFEAPTRPSTRPDTSNDRIRAEERIAITSPPSMTPTWVSSLSMGLPFRLRTTSSSTRLPTCSPQSNKRDASMKTPTKGRILLKEGNSPDKTSLNVTIHESPDASPRRRLHFGYSPRSHTAAPGCRTSTIPNLKCAVPLIFLFHLRASHNQFITLAFDVFMDDARNDHTTDEAFAAETTNISAPGRDQEQEKENIGRGIP